VLSQDERRQLALLEEQIRSADPAFDALMAGPAARRRFPLALVLLVALTWVVAVSLMAVGWWVAATVVGVSALVVSGTLAYRRRWGKTPAG
jgi:fatty acid desaturase